MYFYYGMRLRPFGIGCQPQGCKGYLEDIEAEGYWNIIKYDRPLTEKEKFQYDLDFVTFAGWAIKANGSF